MTPLTIFLKCRYNIPKWKVVGVVTYSGALTNSTCSVYLQNKEELGRVRSSVLVCNSMNIVRV